MQGLAGSESSSETGLNKPITEDDSLQVSGRMGFSLAGQHSFETIAEAPENIPKVRLGCGCGVLDCSGVTRGQHAATLNVSAQQFQQEIYAETHTEITHQPAGAAAPVLAVKSATVQILLTRYWLNFCGKKNTPK